MNEFLQDLLDQMEVFIASLPRVELEDGECTYILTPTSRSWSVRKLVDVSAVDYTVRRSRNSWTCTCPAGLRGIRCKHIVWVDTIVSISRKANAGFLHELCR